MAPSTLARTNGMGFQRDRMVITSANKNLELTAKCIDAQYAPLQSVQNNWGTYGDEKQQNIFEFDEASNSLKHLPLNGTCTRRTPSEDRGWVDHWPFLMSTTVQSLPCQTMRNGVWT